MATAYKAKDYLGVDGLTNWAEVGSNVSDYLLEERRVRQEKRDAIDSATRESIKIIENIPRGENDELNKFASESSESLIEQTRIDYQLLTNGDLSLREWTAGRQNLKDGTESVFNLLDNYNREYERKMAMNDPNLPISEQGSEVQNWLMGNVEGFANFSRSKMVINPITKVVSMAMLIPNPDDPSGPMIPDPNPNNLVTAQQLENRIKGTITKFDVDKAADEWQKTLGVNQKVITELGTTYTKAIFQKIKDATAKKGGLADMSDEEFAATAKELGMKLEDLKKYTLFESAQNKFIQSKLNVGTMAGMSTLIDYVGLNPVTNNPFVPTFDTDEVDPKSANYNPDAILMKSVAGKVEAALSKEQMALATLAMRDAIDIKIDYEEDATAVQVKTEPRAQSAAEIAKGTGDAEKKALVSNWSEIYYKTGKEREAALSSLPSSDRGLQIGLQDVKFIERQDTDDQGNPIILNGQPKMTTYVEFYYKDPARNRTGDNSLYVGDNPTTEAWDRIGSEIHGVVDATEIRKQGGGYPKGSTWSGDISGSSAGRDGSQTVNYTNEVKAVKNPIMESVIADQTYTTEQKMIPKLQEVYKGLGYTFKSGSVKLNPFQWVMVIPPGGTEKTGQNFEIGKADQRKAMLEFINANMDSKLSQDAIESGSVTPRGKSNTNCSGGFKVINGIVTTQRC